MTQQIMWSLIDKTHLSPLLPPFWAKECNVDFFIIVFSAVQGYINIRQCKSLSKVDVMLLKSLTHSVNMTFMQKWPEQGWALLHLFLVTSFSQADEQLCTRRGDPENPELVMDGDILLGGLFSFHTSWKERKTTYREKPLPLQCTR